MPFFSGVDALKTWFEQRPPRERVMLLGMGSVAIVLAVGLVVYLTLSKLDTMRERNEATRLALVELARLGDAYQAERQRNQQIEDRMPATPLELNSYIETAAATAGVRVGESSEVNPVTMGPYVQRGQQIRLRGISLAQLVALLSQLERSTQHIVQVTRIDLNARFRQQEQLDVVMVVSTYDRARTEKTDKDRKRT